MNTNRIAEWRDALLLPGETDLIESGLRELSEYFDISREEARRACERSIAASKVEWESAQRTTEDEVLDFYRRTRSYLFEHIWWHAVDVEANAANVEILHYAKSRGATEYMDFGSGIGANAILFARCGLSVTLADVSQTMLDFARWRLQRRGLKADFIDLNQTPLPEGRFDFITAVDVCEHLYNPAAEFGRLNRSLKPGGALVFNYRAGFDEDRPMHILATAAPVLRALRQNRFRKVELTSKDLQKLDYIVVERTDQSRLEDVLLGAFDYVRYSKLFMPALINAPPPASSARAIRHPQRIYLDHVKSAVKPQTRWLDIGCGRQLVPYWMKGGDSLESEMKSIAKWLVGVDPDFSALRDNGSCQLRVNTDAVTLPFADGCFDLATSNMVFEHVESPRPTLKEIRRVLKRGGRFIALTPNWLDFVTIAARAVPNRFHPALVSRMEIRGPEDVYPTHFKFNRPGAVEKLMREAGFNYCRIERLDHPDVYSHVPLVSKLETAWHEMARRWPALRGTLLIEGRAD